MNAAVRAVVRTAIYNNNIGLWDLSWLPRFTDDDIHKLELGSLGIQSSAEVRSYSLLDVLNLKKKMYVRRD